MEEVETWRPIPGYGGHYEASSLGRIRVKDRVVRRKHSTGGMVDFFYKGRLLSPSRATKLGHMTVHLGVDGRKLSASVHRLVLEAFVGPCPDGMEGCHEDGNPANNRPGNLRWDTHYENNQDRKRHGTYATGEAHAMAKLTDAQVSEIRSSGKRYRQVAEEYGISRSQAHRICKGQSWRAN